MIAPIEADPLGRYGARMRSLALTVLTLLAVLLMPFGMTSAPAAPGDHQSANATEHCPDQGTKSHANDPLADCMMACSAALPAHEGLPVESLSLVRAPAEPGFARVLTGLVLEIATPPPKLS